MSATIRYETTECSRCGGTGRYSYNSMSGSTCFKCGGRKTQLTRAGSAARKVVENWLNDNATLPAAEVRPSMVVRFSDGRWRNVVSVEPDALNAGRIKITTKNMTYGCTPDSRIRIALSAALVDALDDFARDIRGVTIVRAESTAQEG